jgi:hypothetical protein
VEVGLVDDSEEFPREDELPLDAVDKRLFDEDELDLAEDEDGRSLEVELGLVDELDSSEVVEELEEIFFVEELVIDELELELPGPHGPVLTNAAFVPPVVPSLLKSTSSQKSLRTMFCV